MADISHHGPDIAAHPDVAEMRARYARMESRRGVVAIDGLVLLAGLYAAISPWVVHFGPTNPNLQANNLILGIAVAVIGLCLTLAPERMYRLSGVVAPIGVWLIISPWVVTVGHHPTAGMIWNNVLVGGLCCALGLAATGMLLSEGRSARS
ncbi:SPW repeat protein [Streptacidiphilus sp. EB129]|uniref:SPW repeat protein n=1 Tax=Streptacidiphilus sp. EB129 TaxID=3156262 RepID=UPI0035121A03